jgi:hypothetical protein
MHKGLKENMNVIRRERENFKLNETSRTEKFNI